MNRLGVTLTDQVVVFQATIFQPQFQGVAYRVWKVLGGFGASPLTNGRKIFCRALLDGEETTFDAMAVERLATSADLAAVEAVRHS